MHLKETISEQTEELRRNDNLKDNFIGVLAHDLRNPLGAIKQTMSLILDDDLIEDDPTTASEFVRRIGDRADFCLELINDLLDSGRIKDGLVLCPEPICVSDLVAKSLEGVEFMARDKSIVISTKEKTSYSILADKNKMLQVTGNLLSNAIKFTPHGGEVSISIDDVSGQLGRMLRLTVSDNGRGIASEDLDKIFNKYEQVLESDFDFGIGLGLSIVKEICTLHKGSIEVESKLGEGSSFIVTIPLAA